MWERCLARVPGKKVPAVEMNGQERPARGERMGRRFNDDPINVIRRIPSPEQLDAARPTKPTLGQLLSQKGAAFVRSAMEVFSSPSTTTTERQPESQDGQIASHDRLHETGSYLAPESECRPDEGGAWPGDSQGQHGATLSVSTEAAMSSPQSGSAGSHGEEIGELRTFLLRQQQDIVRLTAQIQELKAIIQSQQQVLLCFEKESEAASDPFREEQVASAVTTGNTLIRIRPKPVMKEKRMAEKGKPTRASLNL